jgi:hypothetical protein
VSELTHLGTEPPAFWVELEAEFSRQLRLPLEVSKRGFAESSQLSEVSLGLEARGRNEPRGDGLVVYHRQVWMRFFETLQHIFPRLSAGLGYFEFNRIAHQYLLVEPSRHVDLGRIGDTFGAYVRGTRAARPALLECLAFDEAEMRAQGAKYEPPWQPETSELARAFEPQTRVRYAASFTLLESKFRVSRATADAEAGAEFVPLAEPEYHVCLREERRVVIRSVAAGFARFLELCAAMPLLHALGSLEVEWLMPHEGTLPKGTDRSPCELNRLVQAWVGEAVRAGIWVGI